MRKILIVAIMALLGCCGAYAQRHGGDHRQQPSVEQRVSELRDSLALTDIQVEQILALYTQFQERTQGGDANRSREQLRTEREALNTQIEALLTDEQKVQFEQLNSRHKRGKGKK